MNSTSSHISRRALLIGLMASAAALALPAPLAFAAKAQEAAPEPHPTPDSELQPEPEPEQPTEPAPTIIGRYSSGGSDFTLYSDGSIDAQTDEGIFHFASMADLRAHIEAQNGQG